MTDVTSNKPCAASVSIRTRALLLVLAVFCVVGNVAAIPTSERQFLLDIHAQMNPQFWFNNTGWNGPEGTECSWYGVICDSAQEHVVGIEMVDNFIYGEIPASLSEQTQLRIFNLRANYFFGTIPPLSKLVNLEVFEASGFGDGSFPTGGLTGSIPSLNGLTRLWRFNVQVNSLSGALPSFGPESGLTSLRHFVSGGNLIAGTIPTLEGVPALERFYVEYNQITGAAPEIRHLPNFELFSGGSNGFSGPLPEISGMQKLRFYNAWQNLLDRMPESFDDLPLLEEYVVSFNQLEGPIPSFGAVPKLRQHILAMNRLSGSIPALDGLTGLREIYFNGNRFTGSFPAINGLPNLNYFHAGDNLLTGELPAIQGMTALYGFGARNNALTGSIPALTNLPNLFDFDVSGNGLTGVIPVLLGAPTLWSFQVQGNHLTGGVPRIGPLNQMATFNVSNNQLTGAPPAAVPISLSPQNGTTGALTALCPNYLDPTTSAAWDNATGQWPWHQTCTDMPDGLFADGFEFDLASGAGVTDTAAPATSVPTPEAAWPSETGVCFGLPRMESKADAFLSVEYSDARLECDTRPVRRSHHRP